MNEAEVDLSYLILLIGAALVLTVATRASLARLSLPALAGYIVLGLLINLVDSRWRFIDLSAAHGLALLADIGIIALLFRVGLESNLQNLVRQLRGASVIWVGNFGLSAVAGFAAVYLLGYGLLPALFVGAALTATSIGVTAATWQEMGTLQSENGALMLDVAELDDVSGVIVMSLLFSLAPLIHAGDGNGVMTRLVVDGGLLLAKFAGFCAVCYLFAHHLEARLTAWFSRLEPDFGSLLLVAGVGFMIAGFAEHLGFSLAIGALFAGLAFSRDPSEKQIDSQFEGIYRFFAPFFFIGIGLSVDLSAIGDALGVGLIVLLAAIIGKLVGAGLPAVLATSGGGAFLIGVSLIPRAEIALVIMQKGVSMGDWAVPRDLFAAVVLVSLATCLATPFAVRWLFQRFGEVGT